MASKNYYDVTQWRVGNPYEDIGEVINSILADIKKRQAKTDVRGGGKPGAVIYIPPGDYHLTTQVAIDISYLKIMGSGHGFTSSSIRFNLPEHAWANCHELWPGGSRILVELPPAAAGREEEGAAFYVSRDGNPRISSVEFADFCIDGMHFLGDGKEENPENTYINGKTGIYVAGAQDSFRITGMGMVYLEHGITVYHADALDIHDNFIAECGNCIELRDWGQASKVTENIIGAGYKGYSIYAQNFGGLLVTANNIFPRGASSIYFSGVARSSITANRIHAFYPGMVVLQENCLENLISSNHFLCDPEPWPPMQGHDNGLGYGYGLLYINGSHNSVIANHFSLVLDGQEMAPSQAEAIVDAQGAGLPQAEVVDAWEMKLPQAEVVDVPVMIHIVAGKGNYVAGNHAVATVKKAPAEKDGSCFSMQVEALLAGEEAAAAAVTAVLVEKEAVQNTVLDSGSDAQVVMDKTVNAFRAVPVLE